MPSAPPRPCSYPGCGALVRGASRCEKHKPQAWAKSATYQRESGRRLQRKREELFSREPLCRECLAQGRVSVAEIRDHIVPLAEGGADTDENVQPLCRPCSDAKTAAERVRGQARGRGV